MDAVEHELLAATVHAALTDADGRADEALTELGWLDMLATEPDDAIAVVFGALGRTGRSASALDDVLAAALGRAPNAALAVVLPDYEHADPPARRGLATARVENATELCVVTRNATMTGVTTVAMSAVTVTPVHGIDPELGLHQVAFDAGTPQEIAADRWDDAVARGRRALAHQIAGACHTMLGLARTHAVERVQFGRPIARFQAVRHRLAEALVAVEALDATLAAAADEPNPMTAALAKATAGRTARTVARQCQQVLAGIGFTTDHPFHQFYARTIALEGLFGSAETIELDLGRALLAARHVPTLIEL
jgi:hypothetical protein